MFNKKISIRAKFALLTIGLLVSAITTMGVMTYKESTKVVLSEKQEDTLLITKQVGKTLENYFRIYEISLDQFAKKSSMLGFADDQKKIDGLINSFEKYIEDYSSVSSIYFGTPNKAFYIHPYAELIDFDPTIRPWYIEAVETKGDVIWTDIYIDTDSGSPIISAAKAIYDKDDKLLGVLSIDLHLIEVAEMINGINIGDTGYVTLIDGKNKVVAHRNNELLGEILPVEVLLEEITNNNEGIKEYTIEENEIMVEKFAVYSTIDMLDWTIMGILGADEIQGASKGIMDKTIIFGILSLVIALIISYLFSTRIVKPLKKLNEVSKELIIGNTDVEIDIKSNDEIEELGNVFIEIIDEMKKQAEIVENISKGNIDVDVEIRSEKDLLNKSLSKMVENIDETNTIVNKIVDDSRSGKLRNNLDTSHLDGAWKEIAEQINELTNVFVHVFDSLPITVAAFDKEYNIQFVNKTGEELLGKDTNQLSGTKCFDSFKTEHCNTEKCACSRAMAEKISIQEETISNAKDTPMDINYAGIHLEDKEGNIVGAFEIIMDQTEIKSAQRKADKQAEYQNNEVSKLLHNLDQLSKGNLNIQGETAEGDKDTKILELTYQSINENLNNTVSTIKSYIDEITEVLGKVAKRDMTESIERVYSGDFEGLKNPINNIVKQLNEVLYEINVSVEQVETGTVQVAESSQNLSQGAAEQASSVEEISATVTEIAEQTKENAKNASKASIISNTAKNDALNGDRQMTFMLEAMGDIKESSNNIGNIIKVIDEIAFQTNILALNAAVEAARAGEHGKGFAVVAEEVRNLAGRSAKAAKETTEMIDLSIRKVEEGYEIANDTASALKKIVEGVETAETIVEIIAEASNQQASAIAEIDSGVGQISQVTQINTATAEESASASEEIASQAQILKTLINSFELLENENIEFNISNI